MIKKYRMNLKFFTTKEPVIVEALQWTGNNHLELNELMNKEAKQLKHWDDLWIFCKDKKEPDKVHIGDFIIKYPNCKFMFESSEDFHKYYEENKSEK